MATLRNAVINVHRLINSNKGTIAAPTNPLLNLRSLFGYSMSTPFTSDSHTQSLEIDLSNEESKRRLFNRLLYRSKQRGFLELDLVLGKWVEDNIHLLDENRIKALIHVLDVVRVCKFRRVGDKSCRCDGSENPDLWKWISGQEQPPESISANPVFAAVRGKVMKSLDSHSAPEARATPGQPWVRGWDDIKKGRDGPASGNQ